MRALWLVAALVLSGAAPASESVAYFAGGCFWCTEADFERLDGVTEVVSGYMGGQLPDPSYEQVSRGGTGHAEAVRVHYDPRRISYRELVAFHWRNIDPTVEDRQFCDHGSQYRSGIYYRSDAERRTVSTVRFAEVARADAEAYWRSGEPADKAGAYAIQGYAARWVRAVEGSVSAVIGLPLVEAIELLARFDVHPRGPRR